MKEEQKKYIEKYLDLIENNEWEEFFKRAPEGIAGVLYIAGLDFMNHLSEIPYRFFYNSMIKDITIPNNITSIGEEAFYDCNSLTSVTMSDCVTDIRRYAFAFCNSLTSVTIPDSVTSIEDWVFAWCDNLTSVTLPNKITRIESGAFNCCYSLKSVKIPSSVTSIEKDAFYNCNSLKNISIPNSVTSIKTNAFSKLGSDVVINFDGTKEQWKNMYTSEAFTATYFTVNCLDGSLHKKKR